MTSARHERTVRAAHKAGRNAAGRHAKGEHVTAPDPLAGSLLARKASTAWHAGFAEARGLTSGAESKAASGYDLTPQSGMISLDIPPGVVNPVPGGVTDHHVTVVYLGPDVSDDDFDEACSRAQDAASRIPGPLAATLSGISSFPADPETGKKPVIIPASIPGGDRLRNDLADLSASQHANWTPHVTTHYDEAGAPLPEPQPHKVVTFTHLAVHRGDDVRRFPFGGDSAAKGATGMLETKVGPRGFVHGWHFLGIPGTGDHVNHPSHGKGVVTAVTDKHVSVKFASGASRTFEHSAPKAGQATGFVKRGDHEASATGQAASPQHAAHAATARHLAAGVRGTSADIPVKRGGTSHPSASAAFESAAAHFDRGDAASARQDVGAAGAAMERQARINRTQAGMHDAEAAATRGTARSGDNKEAAARLREPLAKLDASVAGARSIMRATKPGADEGEPAAAGVHDAGKLAGAGSAPDAARAAKTRKLAEDIRVSGKDVPLAGSHGGTASLALDHAAARFGAGDHAAGVAAVNDARHAMLEEADRGTFEAGQHANVARRVRSYDPATAAESSARSAAAGQRADILRQHAGHASALTLPAGPPAPVKAADPRADALAKASRIHEADKAQGAGHLPPLALMGNEKHADGSVHAKAVDHLGRDYTVKLGGDKSVTVTHQGRSMTEHGGPNPTQKARELAGKLTAPPPAEAEPEAHDGFWADEPAPAPPALPAPKPKFEQGGMFAEPDKLGTAPMFGDKFGTDDITKPNASAVAPPVRAWNGAGGTHAAAARSIADNVRLEPGLTKGQREEAETRLYAAASHLDAGRHEDAARELDAVTHAAGLRGGGVIKGSTAAKARDLGKQVRGDSPVIAKPGADVEAPRPAAPLTADETRAAYQAVLGRKPGTKLEKLWAASSHESKMEDPVYRAGAQAKAAGRPISTASDFHMADTLDRDSHRIQATPGAWEPERADQVSARMREAAGHLRSGNYDRAYETMQQATEVARNNKQSMQLPGGADAAHMVDNHRAVLSLFRRKAETKSLPAELSGLAAAITSVSGREATVRNHLAVAGAALESGDTKTAYGALDLARRYALGEFGAHPDRPVLLGDRTEAWRPILRLRDSVRSIG